MSYDVIEPQHHHRSHHNDDHKEEKHWAKQYAGWFWIGICAFFVLIIIVLFVVWGTSWNQISFHDRSLRDIDRRLVAQKADFSSNGLYSLAASFKTHSEYDLWLCHMSMYELDRLAPDAPELFYQADRAQRLLGKPIVAQSLEDEAAQYMIKSRFWLRYNVPAEALGFNKAKLGMNDERVAEQRYLVVHYEVATSYAHFASVKLVEYSQDIYRKTMRMRREITLCSNAQQGTTRRCNDAASMDEILILNNTRVYQMDQVNSAMHTRPRATPSAARGQPVRQEEERDEVGIDLLLDEKESAAQLENEMANTRAFLLLFTRERTVAGSASRTPARGEPTRQVEYVALAVEPTRCS